MDGQLHSFSPMMLIGEWWQPSSPTGRDWYSRRPGSNSIMEREAG